MIERLAELDPGDVVLEVGPGLGVLTRFLAERVAHVHAVEVDRRLAPHLDGHRADDGPLGRCACGSTSRASTRRRTSSSRTCRTTSRRRSSPRASNVEQISGWCVMVQREVADRFFARAVDEGVRRASPCSSSSRPSAPASIRVSREVFRPRPNVESALVAFRRTGPGATPQVKRVVEGAFGHRRKTLANSLSLSGARHPRACGRGARSDRPRRERARRGARRPQEFVALAGGARHDAGPRRRRSTSRSSSGRAATTGKHELATVYQRVDLGDRITVEPAARDDGRGLPRGHDRPRGARDARRSARLAGADREAHPGRRRARRRQLRRGDGAAARERTARAPRGRPRSCTQLAARSAPTCRSSSATARSSAPATAPASSRSICRRTSPSCSCSRTAP